MKTVDLVIPTVNGLSLLQKHLPTVIKLSPQVRHFIIVDDGSIDSTSDYLKKLSPKIKVVTNTVNVGFTRAVNQGFAASDADFIVLINNDVEPLTNYLKSSLKLLENPKVFAVTFNEENSSYPLVSWRDGKYQYLPGTDKTRLALSAWASGGSAIFRRVLWNELGGFNPIYSPGYWEDIDLGWRAWKAGYRILWDPEARVDHQHESTFSKLKPGFVNLIKQRNELLFIWQNFSDWQLRLDHLRFLITYSVPHPGYLKIIFAALLKLPYLRRPSAALLSDRQVLNILTKPHDFKN